MQSSLVIQRRNDPNTGVLRALSVLAIAIAVHVLPLMLLKLAPVPLIDDTVTFAVDLDDSLLETPLLTSELPAERKAAPTIEEPPPQQKAPEPPPHQPKAAAQEQPKAQQQPAAAPKAPEPPPEKAPETAEQRPALKQPDLDPFNSKPQVAFDESKATAEVPKDGYLSDRISTAADRGPKNLPRGDPFMDKGQSNRIRYQETRGEGNLPAIESSATAGSIKKEGNPEAGKGIADKRPADEKAPLRLPVQPSPKPQAGAFEAPPVPPATTTQQQPLAVQPTTPLNIEPLKKDETKKLLGDGPGPEDEVAVALPRKTEQTPVPAARVTPEPPKQLAPPPIIDSPSLPQASAPPPKKPVDELDMFKALLDGKGETSGRGGNAGDKAGIHAREGQRGHEGDGSMRPGHDEAVSDVTTINLDSSAAEFDDARFAKKFDAKTAYVKPLARRIDGKWKAELVARLRSRAVRGVVTVRVKLGSDGTLLGTEEVRRTPNGLPDEYVAIVKTAVQRACAPKSEPFPPALASRETLEFEFSFLY